MITTYHSADAIWGDLRATRCDPPGAAPVDAERRQTYVFGLEQAEQMFRAAASVGPATQPLLVFYGLSQAGRAVAAAASKIPKDDEGWRLEGHGISTAPDSLRGPLPDIRIRAAEANSRGSFARLSNLLGSPLWNRSVRVTLNELWDCLPENRLSPLSDNGQLRRTPLAVDDRSLFADDHPLVSVPVIYFPPWVINSPHGAESLAEYLVAFPETHGYDSYVRVSREPGAAPDFSPHVDGWGELVMNWLLPGGQPGSYAERLAFIRAKTRLYDGSQYFFPAHKGVSNNFHPLMTWWAVLHALSMLARYQPAEWAAHIHVDSSRHAVPLERLLHEAMTVVPKLIAEAIDEVAQPSDRDQ